MKYECWEYETESGVFRIVPIQGRFHAMFEDESLGTYQTTLHALEDLVGGYTFWPSTGIDPAGVGLPKELEAWTFISSPRR